MYIGRDANNISNVEKLDNITFDGSATYALTKSSAAFTPVGANNILVSIDGVIQQGNFSVSTTNIVFDWSPTSSNTCNFILHYGTGVLNVPADGSIVAAKMAANSVDSDSYVDGSIDAVHLSANSVDSDAYVDASIDNAHLADDAVGVAELSATGTASSSTFLRGDNAWAAAGGGKIAQVITATHATSSSNNTDSYATTGLTADITPSATSSKIFISYQVPMYQDGNGGSNVSALHAIYKDGSSLQEFGVGWGMISRSINFAYQSVGVYLDSPSSTSSLTYAVFYRPYDTGEGQIIYACPDSTYGGMATDSTASLVLMEVTA